MRLLPINRWISKPPPGTDLDRAHSDCPDYCWPFLSFQGTPQVLSRASALTPVSSGDINFNSSIMVPGRKYGLSVKHQNQNDILALTNASVISDVDRIVGLSEGHTLLLAYHKVDVTPRNASVLGLASPGPYDDIYSINLPWQDGNLMWRYGGITDGVNQVTIGGLTYGDDLWVFTTGPRGMEVWQNGILRGSHSGNPTRVATKTGEKLAWPGWGADSDLAEIGLIMTWKRQLSMSSIRDLTINPWQVFQARNYFVYDPFTAPSNEGAFNIPGAATVSFVGAEATSPLIQSGAFTSSGLATVNWNGSFVTVITDIKIKLEDGTWTSLL